MSKIGIYLPKYHRLGNDDVLKEIDSNVLRKQTLKLAEALTDFCGGCTLIEVTGFYKFPDGFFSEAPTYEMYCFCDQNRTGEVSKIIKPMLSEFKLKLAQSSIGMYIDNQFIEI